MGIVAPSLNDLYVPVLSVLKKFLADDTGVTPVEYGLIAAIVIVATTIAASAAGYSLADLIP